MSTARTTPAQKPRGPTRSNFFAFVVSLGIPTSANTLETRMIPYSHWTRHAIWAFRRAMLSCFFFFDAFI
jgi:hypothetical protein